MKSVLIMLTSLFYRLAIRLGILRLIARLVPNMRGAIEFPPGHFYSPLLDIESFLARQANHTERSKRDWAMTGLSVEGHLSAHREYLELTTLYGMPSSKLYSVDNPYFFYADAFTASAMIAKYKPSRIVEIGCGFSSAAMLDAVEACNLSTTFHFIDPYPERLLALAPHNELKRHQISEKPVQEVGDDVFAALQPNDILFIDSSHVLKIGSDLNHILLRVLPIIPAGTIVHVHDVFYPLPYPPDWITRGRAWNEALIVQVLLRNSDTYEILFFNSYIQFEAKNELSASNPKFLEGIPASLWLRKR
jgi:hypothetical protein